MPHLEHFTEVQADEVRQEFVYYLRPYRIRFWLVLAGFIIGSTLGLFAYEHVLNTETQDSIHNAHVNCVLTRQLVINIVLRSINSDYQDYRQDPNKAIAQYRNVLMGNSLYRDNPQLLQDTLHKTRVILNLADPSKCL